jgi:hypothetical protein
LAFESGADEFAMLVRFAEAAEGLALVDALVPPPRLRGSTPSTFSAMNSA